MRKYESHLIAAIDRLYPNAISNFEKYFVKTMDIYVKEHQLLWRLSKFDAIHIYEALELCISRSIYFNIGIFDKSFLKKIKKILKSCLQSPLSKISNHHFLEYNALLSEYYFWFRYDRTKALKYRYRAFNVMKKFKYRFSSQFFKNWHRMEIAVQNYEECKRITQMAANWNVEDEALKKIKGKDIGFMQYLERELIKLYQDHQRKCPKLWKGKHELIRVPFEQYDQNLIKFLITNWMEREQSVDGATEGRKYYVRFTKLMKRLLMKRRYFNVMNNVIKIRMCNYELCVRKDLKRYRICQRCKSVYYCCRNHQKKDWVRGDHKRYCEERKDRDYDIFLKRYELDIDDVTKAFAWRMFR